MNKRFWLSALGSAAAVGTYLKVVRPRHIHWGASAEEVHRTMLGDALLKAPTYVTTRAITIDTPAENVWPWLVQMGEKRGGFYSYDLIDRLIGMKVHSAHRILPRYQDIEVGDALDTSGNMVILGLEPNRAMVIGPGESVNDIDAAWTIALYPTTDGRTRLISRVRARFNLRSPRGLLLLAILDPGQFIMEQKFLRELKAHAEGRSEKWPREPSVTYH